MCASSLSSHTHTTLCVYMSRSYCSAVATRGTRPLDLLSFSSSNHTPHLMHIHLMTQPLPQTQPSCFGFCCCFFSPSPQLGDVAARLVLCIITSLPPVSHFFLMQTDEATGMSMIWFIRPCSFCCKVRRQWSQHSRALSVSFQGSEQKWTRGCRSSSEQVPPLKLQEPARLQTTKEIILKERLRKRRLQKMPKRQRAAQPGILNQAITRLIYLRR